MRKLSIHLAAFLLLVGGHAFTGVPARAQEKDAKAATEEWLAKADSTRTIVESVLGQAVEAGAEEHAVAKGSVADARLWISEAEKTLERCRAAIESEDYEKASTLANMTWQYYVKAGTAAVLAARLVGGGGGG